MPLVPRTVDRGPSYGAPSNLADVIAAVEALFNDIGDATPILVGEHYVSANAHSVGSGPHVVLVPEPDGGAAELAPPYEAGNVAKDVHVCDVIVRSTEPGGDVDRWRNVYALNDRVASCVRRATAGKVAFGRASKPYPSPLTVDSGAGAQRCWGFTYDRDIRPDAATYGAAPAPADATPEPDTLGTLDTLTGGATLAEE